jgi:AcrR family transcriptional regulator
VRTTRRDRERDLVRVTRALFDEAGMQDAGIDAIARAAGINRALIYRSFASKEELFVATVADYLAELTERAAGESDLHALLDAYTGFCLEYPAFLDCALSLMRRPADELEASVSDGVWLRMAQRMAACLRPLRDALAREGAPDPDFLANRMYTMVLGTMHLARLRVGVREVAPGVPAPFALDPEDVRRACVEDALRLVR